eukprot:8795429-Pyramimonas_sp.AAC.1
MPSARAVNSERGTVCRLPSSGPKMPASALQEPLPSGTVATMAQPHLRLLGSLEKAPPEPSPKRTRRPVA